jgi:HEPN domain-containing protein
MGKMIFVTETADELFDKAERDLLTIKILNQDITYPADRKGDIICFHAAQAVEKFLKGFIIGKNEQVEKMHDLIKLLEQASRIDRSFDGLKKECLLINKFTPDIKYSHEKTITKSDIDIILRSLASISNFPPLKALRDSISKKYKYEIITEISTRDRANPSHAQNAMPNGKKKQDLEPDIGY